MNIVFHTLKSHHSPEDHLEDDSGDFAVAFQKDYYEL
jgi:hypothetical protein